MKNYHETSELFSEAEIARLSTAFEQSWSKETCFPAQQPIWSEENKALGQCAVTVLVVHDLYGGEFVYDRSNNHYWNILPDKSQQDFGRKQFAEGTIFIGTDIKKREDILSSPGALRAKTSERYNILKEKVQNALENNA